MTVQVVRTKRELAQVRGASRPSAVVMTMGALHDGHASLVRRARELVGDTGQVLVTVFVNPLQFGPAEDFARYPRTFDADVALCEAMGADVVFAPDVGEMYSDDAEHAITIAPGALGDVLEGAVRPGHFAGMLTVVNKLLNLTAADLALFGEKDYQQLTLIRRMVDDLDLTVEIVPVETVREPDGLAMSSRNRYLSAGQRALAARVPQALRAVVDAAPGSGADAAVAAGLVALDCEGITVDYLTVTDPLLGPVREGPARALVAVRIGTTRLIDNMACVVGPT